MAAPRAAKRKASEKESSKREAGTKTARTTNGNHESNSSSSNIDAVILGADPWARVAATGHNNSNNNVDVDVIVNGATSGRGSVSGWTHCPLCGSFSKKKHALGRGIANHLKDVHTPWNPGKLAQKIHKRQHERRTRARELQLQLKSNQRVSKKRLRCPVEEEENGSNSNSNNMNETMEVGSDDRTTTTASEAFKPLASWTPTEEENKAWAATILDVLKRIEKERTTIAYKTITDVKEFEPEENENNASRVAGSSETMKQKPPQSGEDKTGNAVIAYRDSLPPFLMAASKGDLKKLQELVEEANQKDGETPGTLSVSSKTRELIQNNSNNGEKIHNNNQNHHLRALVLNTKDRHKSTADHWAAGGGHLDCLRYLYNLRATLEGVSVSVSENHHTTEGKPQQTRQDLESNSSKRNNHKARRRDGKTCLHYAARNGHVHCIRYLLDAQLAAHTHENAHENLHTARHTVDERSGEGSTPLHLACYGGHPAAVKILVEDYGADPKATNDWGCTCAHWAAMTFSNSESSVRDLCGYLSKTCGISFTAVQGQGHTALHKAAHKRNEHVIRWMAEYVVGSNSNEKAGAPDLGGHKPSDIWRNMGGDATFAAWMKTSMGW